MVSVFCTQQGICGACCRSKRVRVCEAGLQYGSFTLIVVYVPARALLECICFRLIVVSVPARALLDLLLLLSLFLQEHFWIYSYYCLCSCKSTSGFTLIVVSVPASAFLNLLLFLSLFLQAHFWIYSYCCLCSCKSTSGLHMFCKRL